jgi:hypothetical protein
MAPTTTIMQDVLTAMDAGVAPRFSFRPTMKISGKEALMIGADNGNRAFKGAALGADGTLATVTIPTAHRDAEQIRGGTQDVTVRVNDSAPFWIGETALAHDGDALPVASTPQRLADIRQRQFLAACVVELLIAAGYPPGHYPLVLGFAVPNTEIVLMPDDAGGDKLGVDPKTQAALVQHLKGSTWQVVRTDERGQLHCWTLSIVTVLPQAQTSGTILATTKAANGKTVSAYDSMVVLDLGGGDLHATEVTVRPRYQMLSRRVGDGSVRLARALRLRLPKAFRNDAQAQQALIDGEVLQSGRYRRIDAEIQAVLDGPGQAIITEVLDVLEQTRSHVLLTGGLIIPLEDRLCARFEVADKVGGVDYTLIDGRIAPILNAIGVLFGVAFRAAGR